MRKGVINEFICNLIYTKLVYNLKNIMKINKLEILIYLCSKNKYEKVLYLY